MKKLFCFIMIASILFISGCGYRTYEDGYDDGYDAGYEDAESEMEYQIEEEWYSGYDIGYDDGYYDAEKELEDDYEEGYGDGYYAGATFASLFFGDIDRAFQCAQNGSAWRTFIDAYDEYIANIYDTDEMRSKLFWAFVSVMSSDDATGEEIELLIDTFGSDLFVRNGIELNP